MYPAEICVDYDMSSAYWIKFLAKDRLCIYTALFTAQAFFDFSRHGTITPASYNFLSTAIALLRELLVQNGPGSTSESTITTVLSLAVMSDIQGDDESAKRHMEGLYKMTKLRGGVDKLENAQLQIKCYR
jgi:hypothetical protein